MSHAMWIVHEHLQNMAKNYVHLSCSWPIVFSRFYLYLTERPIDFCALVRMVHPLFVNINMTQEEKFIVTKKSCIDW